MPQCTSSKSRWGAWVWWVVILIFAGLNLVAGVTRTDGRNWTNLATASILIVAAVATYPGRSR